MDQGSVSPHVLIYPFPIQGNINSMLKLAELLCLAGIQVTFLNCHYPHRRLLSYSNIQARFSRYPGFRFETISDGLPMEHPRTAEQFLDIVDGVKTTTAPLFMEMMISWCRSGSDTRSPLTCIIADGLMSFAIDVANEVGLPVIIFRAISACSFWAYFSLPQLIEAGEVPFRGGDMDRLVASVPGMEGFLRRRDLPSCCRVKEVDDPDLQNPMKTTRQTHRAHALVINTFDDLEGPILFQIRNHCPRTYTIGWNSTLESIVEGLPMICWPYFADQQINSRFVSHVWKLGMDMKDSCDRVTVEKMVRDLMVEKRDEFMKAADTLATLAKKCVGDGGSSSCNLNSLIEDIRLLST